MRTCDSYEDACLANDLDLRIIWKCDKCGEDREELPRYKEGGRHYCGGHFKYVGETHIIREGRKLSV